MIAWLAILFALIAIVLVLHGWYFSVPMTTLLGAVFFLLLGLFLATEGVDVDEGYVELIETADGNYMISPMLVTYTASNSTGIWAFYYLLLFGGGFSMLLYGFYQLLY